MELLGGVEDVVEVAHGLTMEMVTQDEISLVIVVNEEFQLLK